MKLTNILQITILLLLILIFINYFLVYNQQQKCSGEFSLSGSL